MMAMASGFSSMRVKAAVVAGGGEAGGAAAGEEVEDAVAGVGVDADDAVEDAEGLLGGVAGLLLAGGRDDGVPPDVGGGLAAGALGRADELGGHVGDAVAGVEVEGVVLGVAGVPEDVVVLGGPAGGGAGAVVVGPDDLVLEAGSGEDLVEQDLAVVDLAGVDVEEEAAGGGEQAVGLEEAGAEEAEVVGEEVGVAVGGGGSDGLGAVAMAAEAGAIAGGVADGLDAGAGLAAAGVEGRIDVDEVDGGRFHAAEEREVVALEDLVQRGAFMGGLETSLPSMARERGSGRGGILVGLLFPESGSVYGFVCRC